MRRAAWIAFVLLLGTQIIAAEPLAIEPASSEILIDGVISESEWAHATKYETWYETNPGDNIEPAVKTVGWVTYDSRFLYFAIESNDPNPKAISAPYADHDQISGNTDDYVGVLLDTRNDGKSGYLFLVTARGVQYDAVTDDAGSGEDSSPDFFWDTASKIHDKGWTAEARIPFSSLRYDGSSPEQWGLMLYRNYPRDRRYQMFTNKLPRDVNCFVCSWGKVTGFRDLPTGDHMVLAPYVTANQLGEPRNDLGSEFVNHPVGADGGFDLKWNPTADMTVDATLNPDFSQIESDVAVISTNERFAIFIPEKRPFFLEGVELFSTPIQAVYTRTITSPRFGARTTGKKGAYAYTMLVTQDRGGGDVILPSAFGSDFAQQDFSSIAAIGRVRRDLHNQSSISFLGTTREAEGGAYNRVFGPDFQWRIGDNNTITGQLLYSSTQEPDRADITSNWNGEKLSGHAAQLWYSYSTAKNDFYVQGNDYSSEFRADNGFVPQVGWRGSYLEGGHTWRPTGFFSRVRVFTQNEYQETQQNSSLLFRMMSAGIAADGKFRSFSRVRFAHETVATDGGPVLSRDRAYYVLQFAVNKVISFVAFDGWIGEEIDFSQNRLGRGANMNTSVSLRAGDHLQVNLLSGIRWLNISGDRLFTSQIERVKATYTFNPRMFLRAIVQNQRTHRDRLLYGDDPDPAKTDDDVNRYGGTLSGQLLFAYKLNWQTVFYVGYGDLREVTAGEGEFEPSNRQFFAKVSYAFQR